MGRIRKIVIKNFRCFKYLEWMPNEGINCLIGHGDVGKSTLLDAIELCLGNRGNTQFTDADFYKLDVNFPIEITITLGDLDESLLNFDTYGQFIRGFNSSTGEITDEPEPGTENVIDLHLKVMDDLEHSRTLYSDRSFAQGQRRNLSRPDREKLFPTRIGSAVDHHLTWGHGSILKKISDENMEAISDLSTARKWQKEFSSSATEKVPQTLAIIKDTAIRIGIPIEDVKAMLDINSTFLRGSGISPYDNNVIPLRSLGLGSTRLLIAELQRGVDVHSSIMLVDEVEHGLEPHRLIRLISSLGAKDDKPPHQVFITSHSPVAIKELSTKQLYVLKRNDDALHEVKGVTIEMQGPIRACPEAFLASSVLVCEGASEIGLIRGLDLHRIENGELSLAACGVAITDGNGSNTVMRAKTFSDLGYRIRMFIDGDKPEAIDKAMIIDQDVLYWKNQHSVEEELFCSLSVQATQKLLEFAIEIKGKDFVNKSINSASSNRFDLDKCLTDVSNDVRVVLGKAAKSGQGWFKRIDHMEKIGREIVGPDLNNCEVSFKETVCNLFTWFENGSK